MTLVVINAVGLTPRALQDMPRLSKLAEGRNCGRHGSILSELVVRG